MFVLLNLIESSGVWGVIPNIQTLISLIAFALAVMLSVMLAWIKSSRRKIPTAFWFVLSFLVLVGLVSVIYRPGEIYRVRVTVVDPQSIPIEDAKVWSSFGGEPKMVAGGWQFDIPNASKPRDGQLAIFASRESAFLTGKTDLVLSNDYNPAVIIRLQRDDSAKVRGLVVDGNNRAIAGARVFVVGFEGDAVITKEGGNFELPAHAAVGQMVNLHTEKAGFLAVTQEHPAGDHPATLVLEIIR